MKSLVFVFLVVLLAISVNLGFAQEYDGQVGGGNHGGLHQENGTVESIETPQTVPETTIDANGVESVGDYEIIRGPGNKPIGFSPPDNPTIDQEKQFLAYARKHDLVSEAQATQMDSDILRKAKAYTDKKFGETKGYTDKSIANLKKEEIDPLKAAVENIGHKAYKKGNKQYHSTGIYAEVENMRKNTADGINRLDDRIDGVGRTGNWTLVFSLLALAIGVLAYFRPRGTIRLAPRTEQPAPGQEARPNF